MGNRMAKWSYSALSLFKQCPRKYYRLRVKKDIPQEESTAMFYGKEAHKAAEDYVRKDTVIPEKFKYIEPYLNILKKLKGEKLCEYEMGLTKDLKPCEFKDKNYWWRGIADLVVHNGDTAYVIDYKTGKSARYADTKQLEILSVATFLHFPKVNYVKAGLLFVVSKDLIRTNYVRSQIQELMNNFNFDVERLDTAFGTNVWNPIPNFTCRKFCPVNDCEHNGGYVG